MFAVDLVLSVLVLCGLPCTTCLKFCCLLLFLWILIVLVLARLGLLLDCWFLCLLVFCMLSVF